MTALNQTPLSEKEKDQIVAYAMGWLNLGEQRVLEEELSQNSLLQTYLFDTRMAMGALGQMVPEREPGDDLKTRLFDQLSIESPKFSERSLAVNPIWSRLPDLEKNQWRSTPFKGVSYQRVFHDPDQQIQGVMLNIEAGAQYPAHRHIGPEFFYLVRGDLVIANDKGAEVRLGAGDFQHSKAGSVHGRFTSPSGCLAMVISSTQDVILEDLAAH